MTLERELLRPRTLPVTCLLVLVAGFTATGLGYPFYVTRAVGGIQLLIAASIVGSAFLGYRRPRIAVFAVLLTAPVLPIPLKAWLGYDALLHLYLVYAALAGVTCRERVRLWQFAARLDRTLLSTMLVFASLAVVSGLIAAARYSPTIAHLLQTVSFDGFTRVHSSYAPVMSFVSVCMNLLLGPILFITLAVTRANASDGTNRESRRAPMVGAVTALLIGVAVSLAFAVVQAYAPNYGLPLVNGWPSGLMTDATALGGTLAMLIPLAGAIAVFTTDRLARGVALAVVGLAALMTIPGESRLVQASILLSPFAVGAGWVAGKAIRGETDRDFWVRIGAVATIGGLIAIGVAAWLLPGTELGGYLYLLVADPQVAEILAGGRDELALVALRMGGDYPVAGIGFGSFTWELLHYYELSGTENRWFDLPHNFYLQVFAEMGIVGVTVLLAFGAAIGRMLLRPLRQSLDPVKVGAYLGGGTAALISFFALLWGPFMMFVEYQVVFWVALYLAHWAGIDGTEHPGEASADGGYPEILSTRTVAVWLMLILVSVVAALLSPPIVPG